MSVPFFILAWLFQCSAVRSIQSNSITLSFSPVRPSLHLLVCPFVTPCSPPSVPTSIPQVRLFLCPSLRAHPSSHSIPLSVPSCPFLCVSSSLHHALFLRLRFLALNISSHNRHWQMPRTHFEFINLIFQWRHFFEKSPQARVLWGTCIVRRLFCLSVGLSVGHVDT